MGQSTHNGVHFPHPNPKTTKGGCGADKADKADRVDKTPKHTMSKVEDDAPPTLEPAPVLGTHARDTMMRSALDKVAADKTADKTTGDDKDDGGSMRLMTSKDMQKLGNDPSAVVYEYKHKRMFEPKPIEETAKTVALLRMLYQDLLELLPEASDAELRTLILEEEPSLEEFRTNIMLFTSTTTRAFHDGFFFKKLELFEVMREAKAQAKDNEMQFKEMVTKHIMENKLYFQSRKFDSYLHGHELEVAPSVPDRLRDLLRSRRSADKRPGTGLLDKPEGWKGITDDEGASA